MNINNALLIIALLGTTWSFAQYPNLHIEGDNSILTIQAPSNNPKLQLTDNYGSTTDYWVFVYDVNDNGQVKWRYDNASMMTLTKVGNLGLETTVPEVKLHIKGGPDAAIGPGTGFLQLGKTNNGNLIIDNNEIMVRSSGTASNLGLQLDGGEVHIGRSALPANLWVRGCTRHGDDTSHPYIRTKKITGTNTSGAPISNILHAIGDFSKILSFEVMYEDDFGGAIFFKHRDVDFHDATFVSLSNTIPNGKNYIMYIVYESNT